MGLEFDYKDGQTPLDEEEKEGLKIKSITTQRELDEFEQLNIENAVEWTIRTKFKPEKILTEKFVKDLHKRMYGEVWNWAGKFRRTEKNIGIPWTQIGVELKNLLDDTKYWIENKTFLPVEIAIRFKHRIVFIHCFPNGNGRHSRMMADIIIESIFGNDIFSWHQSNMVKASETRNQYIKSLREADNGNFKHLIEFAKN
ncbi:toxin (filamentation induced by cAMP protein, mobile mystery protein B) of toxin-antitoxin module, Fic superfamily [Psychroflexus torquis ATCC 700755]|uniref:Toxin (Filamentation induced by cAMP protein, mobile mystery protein B) of toxin-antitoxin module, Fic superfamily n=1 Tax=Psychroflexus torquis (strain ATCC 700755 / CIP 106069 / ACAM 623) TaxID=313595 RepID=K4IF68_PSYTT|nr:mobile mystery protein B [Psychroflexus torquis]AFU67736.1 toxin (filamentation induced by cAMP protein, mobile mystery protein B) of toxin-antitoxin module, Fic superfamily [Psychroflexus torquis ATCC 700755]